MIIRNSNSNFRISTRIRYNNEFPTLCQNLSAVASVVTILEQKTYFRWIWCILVAFCLEKNYFPDFPTYGAPLSELISTTKNRIELIFFLNERFSLYVYRKIKF